MHRPNTTIECDLLVAGAYGQSNFGDDALLAGVLRAATSVIDAERICVKGRAHAAYLQRTYPAIQFLTDQDQATINAKVLLFGGGTQFFSFPADAAPPPLGVRMQRVIRAPLRRLRNVLGKHKTLKIIAEKSAAISVGLGPFVPGSPQEGNARTLARQCAWLSVRDSAALAYCRAWGVRNAHCHADICFSREAWLPGYSPVNQDDGVAHRIGIVVRTWPYHASGRSYLPPLTEAVAELRRHGHAVRYVSFAPSDHPVVRTLEEQGETVLQWDAASNPDMARFLTEFGAHDLLISARAHGVVIGASLGIPSIPIEIEPKLGLIGESIQRGAPRWLPPFNAGELVQLTESLLRRRDDAGKMLAEDMQAAAASAEESLAKLRSFLRSAL